MSHKLLSDVLVTPAVAASAGGVGTMTAIEVDGRGYDRVLYIIDLGVATGGGLFDGKIQEAATSGGGLTDISGSALTQVTKAAGDNKVELIDVPVNPAKPFQKILAVTTTAAFPNAVVALCYKGSRLNPPTQVAGQVVNA
jgi:hypothetical protein